MTHKGEQTTHYFCLNPHESSSEQVVVETKINPTHPTGWVTQKLIMSAGCNSCSFEFDGMYLTPHILRTLADELDAFRNNLKGHK
jgi:hypothetical protein